MKINENEYAEMLIEQHQLVRYAINDVTNTLEALQRIDVATHINEYYFDYYNNVLNILKAKL